MIKLAPVFPIDYNGLPEKSSFRWISPYVFPGSSYFDETGGRTGKEWQHGKTW